MQTYFVFTSVYFTWLVLTQIEGILKLVKNEEKRTFSLEADNDSESKIQKGKPP